jgi:hypothetical protein
MRRIKRALRLLVRVALGGVALGLVLFGWFLLVARKAVPEFHPVDTAIADDTAAQIRTTPKYRRDEDATYLTYVEWYLVFNPQEYAAAIAKERPSRFEYFRGIGQLWSGYANVYGMTRRHYPLNGGYNLMLVVISTSSTVEFGIKGIYEKTLGRIFEWTAGGERTPEDDLAARVAHDYGQFIPTRPWFEFPFGHALKTLWTEPSLFGAHWPRKWERKFFLSVEYGVKAVYATVIRLASHAVYGVADTEVYLSAHNVSPAALAVPGVRSVTQLGPGRWILTVPHYQGFTDTLPTLAKAGVDLEEIAGNDEIMATIVAPREWRYDLTSGKPLFEMPTLSGQPTKRIAVQVPAARLADWLRQLSAKPVRLEHLFDY